MRGLLSAAPPVSAMALQLAAGAVAETCMDRHGVRRRTEDAGDTGTQVRNAPAAWAVAASKDRAGIGAGALSIQP